MDYRVLVVGSGSIGRRHLRNLHALGIRCLAGCDPDPDRLSPMVKELGVQPFVSFEEAILGTKPDLVFICTPPVFHVPQALRAVRAGAHVFIEKPLSHSLAGVDELIIEAEARQRIVQVGYNLRFHPGLQKLKQLVDEGAVGQILWAQAEIGQYLPDWRPWQDYRQSYTARRVLGGGILLDASHEIDYILWLLGQPSEVICLAGKVSNLEVDVEDCVTLLLRFTSGTQADIHMDFIQRSYTRSCKLAGERGSLIWDYSGNQVRVYLADQGEWQSLPYSFETNQMYMHEIEHFLSCITDRKEVLVNLKQGRQTLAVALAAYTGATERRFVSLG